MGLSLSQNCQRRDRYHLRFISRAWVSGRFERDREHRVLAQTEQPAARHRVPARLETTPGADRKRQTNRFECLYQEAPPQGDDTPGGLPAHKGILTKLNVFHPGRVGTQIILGENHLAPCYLSVF